MSSSLKVAAASLLAQMQGLQALGLDMARLRRDIGNLPDDPRAMIPVDQYARMWNCAQAQYGGACLPTALALAIPFGAFGMIDYLSGSASTAAGCCESVALHLRIVTDETRLEITHLEDCVLLSVRSAAHIAAHMPAVAGEFTLAILAARLRHLLGPGFTPLQTHLPTAKPSDARLHTHLFGPLISYAAPCPSMSLSLADWQRSIPRADPYLHRMLREMALALGLNSGLSEGSSRAAELEQSLRARLRDALAEGKFGPMDLARLMGLSERTLQRRLAEADRSFSAIVEGFRHEEALRLLLEPGMALIRIAAELGYSEQTSFTRAFKRWTGSTPAAWRKTQIAARRASGDSREHLQPA